MLLKILVLMHDCVSTNSPDLSTTHPSEPFSIPNHVYDHSQARVGSTCNFKQDQLSWTFQLLLIFLLDSAPSEYTIKMQLCVPDELGILEHISEWARTTNHPWCSHVSSLYDSFELKKTSISGLPSSFWAWQIIARFTCETYTRITAWSCWFYPQLMSLNPYK